MIEPLPILAARKFGEVRYAVISERVGDMSRVLAKFGLKPDASLLVEHDRNSALAILTTLLWKDMAYGGECLPKAQAEKFEREVLQLHTNTESAAARVPC